MKITRLYTGSDGRSHFEERELSFAPGERLDTTKLEAATAVVFRHAGVGRQLGKHRAPRRQYVVTLSGEWEIECGDGAVKRFKAGDVLLAEDMTGEGHVTRAVGGRPYYAMNVYLEVDK